MADLAPPDRSTLLTLLYENNGKLGNTAARRLLSEKAGQEISIDEYELLKEQLLSEGLIKKAQGRGGCIQILSDEPTRDSGDNPISQDEQSKEDDRIERVYTAINYLPGVRVRVNKTALTLLFGDDEDKLFCGWNEEKTTYFIQYRVEALKPDYSDQAETILKEASSDIAEAAVERLANSVTLRLGSSVPVVVHVVRRLKAALDTTNIGGTNTVSDNYEDSDKSYFYEIASLIKYSVDSNHYWPLRKWRTTLGFDEVDHLIHIGSSPGGLSDKYREHVVPVSLVKDEAIKLAEEGAPAEVIADFIKHHLFIVWISFKEAEMLNSKTDVGGCSFKTSMPQGWVVGCDPLERLKDAGIKIHFSKPLSIKPWKPWRGRERLRDKLKKALFSDVF